MSYSPAYPIGFFVFRSSIRKTELARFSVCWRISPVNCSTVIGRCPVNITCVTPSLFIQGARTCASSDVSGRKSTRSPERKVPVSARLAMALLGLVVALARLRPLMAGETPAPPEGLQGGRPRRPDVSPPPREGKPHRRFHTQLAPRCRRERMRGYERR